MEQKNMDQQPLRIELTEGQKALIKQQTGRDVAAVEFTAEELEERVAPLTVWVL